MTRVLLFLHTVRAVAGYHVLPSVMRANSVSLGLQYARNRIIMTTPASSIEKLETLLTQLHNMSKDDIDELFEDGDLARYHIKNYEDLSSHNSNLTSFVAKWLSQKNQFRSLAQQGDETRGNAELASVAPAQGVEINTQDPREDNSLSDVTASYRENFLSEDVKHFLREIKIKRLLGEIKQATKDLLLYSSPIHDDQSAKKAELDRMWAEANKCIPRLQQWFEYKMNDTTKDINGAHRELVFLKHEIRNIDDDIREMRKLQEETPAEHWRRIRLRIDSWEFKQQISHKEHLVKVREESRKRMHDWLNDALDDIFNFLKEGLDRPDLLAERIRLQLMYEESKTHDDSVTLLSNGES